MLQIFDLIIIIIIGDNNYLFIIQLLLSLKRKESFRFCSISSADINKIMFTCFIRVNFVFERFSFFYCCCCCFIGHLKERKKEKKMKKKPKKKFTSYHSNAMMMYYYIFGSCCCCCGDNFSSWKKLKFSFFSGIFGIFFLLLLLLWWRCFFPHLFYYFFDPIFFSVGTQHSNGPYTHTRTIVIILVHFFPPSSLLQWITPLSPFEHYSFYEIFFSWNFDHYRREEKQSKGEGRKMELLFW